MSVENASSGTTESGITSPRLESWKGRRVPRTLHMVRLSSMTKPFMTWIIPMYIPNPRFIVHVAPNWSYKQTNLRLISYRL